MNRANGLCKGERERRGWGRARWSRPVRVAATVCSVAAALAIIGMVPSYDGFGRHLFLPELSGDGLVGLAFIAAGTGVIRSGRRRRRPKAPSGGTVA